VVEEERSGRLWRRSGGLGQEWPRWAYSCNHGHGISCGAAGVSQVRFGSALNDKLLLSPISIYAWVSPGQSQQIPLLPALSVQGAEPERGIIQTLKSTVPYPLLSFWSNGWCWTSIPLHLLLSSRSPRISPTKRLSSGKVVRFEQTGPVKWPPRQSNLGRHAAVR
jgi:hypothetical protein